jgi:hypothetical protein
MSYSVAVTRGPVARIIRVIDAILTLKIRPSVLPASGGVSRGIFRGLAARR